MIHCVHRDASRGRHKALLLLGLGLIALGPRLAAATEFEVLRLASELNYASKQLADELRHERGYSNMRLSANRLGRESEQLVEAIRRDRSPSYVRSQFRDVSRRYNNLETDFMRARRRDDLWLIDSVGIISDLYLNLSAEFYYTRYIGSGLSLHYYGAPSRDRHVGRSLKGSRDYGRSRKGKSAKGRRDRGRVESRRDGRYYAPSDSRVVTRGSRTSRVSETRRRNHYQ